MNVEVRRPASIDEAVSALRGATADTRILAGGTDLMVEMEIGRTSPDRIIDIWRLDELRAITVDDDGIRLGALVSCGQIIRSDAVAARLDILAAAAREVGAEQIRNRATVGGNLGTASPAADLNPVLLALSASVRLVSARGAREVPAAEFLCGYRQTTRLPDELIESVWIPVRGSTERRWFRKVGTRRAQSISKVVVAAAGASAGGKVEDVRVAVGSVAANTILLESVQEDLVGEEVEQARLDAAALRAARSCAPIDDVRSTAEYRRNVLYRVVKQALQSVFGVLLLAIVCGCGADADQDRSSSSPSVVLLILDTLRADRLGSYGCKPEVSPELDAMALKGVVFENVVAQSPWTRPSTGSMLTSRYPRSIGIYEERDGGLDDRFTTLAECFQAAGYSTLGLTANPHLNRSFNFHQGFEHYYDSDVVFEFMEAAGENPIFRTSKLASARQLFSKALDVVGARPDAGPWYLQVNVMDVHEWFRGIYSVTRPEFQRLFPAPRDQKYLQAVRQVSADVDAFLGELLSLPGFEDTLVIVTSEHGEGLWDHPDVDKSRFHGRLLYESQVRVPWILYSSGGSLPAVRVERPVRLLDLMPTVLAIAGLPTPPACEGVSLLPLLSSPAAPVDLPRWFVAETELRDHDKAAVYSAEWKYIEAADGHPGTSPRELQRWGIKENGAATNVLAENFQVAAEMAAFLAAWKLNVPRAEATISPTGISAEEQEQLRNIGYLGDDGAEKK